MSGSVNPSIVFLTKQHCLFADGCGSMWLLYTPCRAQKSEAGVEEWLVLEEMKLSALEGKPFVILAATFAPGESSHHLDVVTMVLRDTAFGLSKSATKPPTAFYHWYHVTLSPTVTIAPSQEPPATAPSVAVSNAPVSSISLLCSLESRTVPLYSAFITDCLLIVSEAEMKVSGTVTEETEKTEEGMESEEPEGKEIDVEEAENKDTNGGHIGLGFDEEKLYNWSQTDSDISIVVTLPNDVTKQDIHCVLDRKEAVIGLKDGTTYFQDHLYAPIDPETSTWTLENHV